MNILVCYPSDRAAMLYQFNPKYFMRILFIIGLPLLLIAYLFYLDIRLNAAFRNVTVGMPQKDVVAVLGEPKIINDQCHWEFVNKNVENCAQIYVYSSIFAPLVPEYPVIWFDKNGQVIEKYEFQSP